MDRTGKKCILYSRVSTEMQVDGFSLAGQKTCLTNFVQREQMKIVGEYEDAGKSGKSIEGRPAFKRMLNDIRNGLAVDYVIVYKLSRFGRNAADVLNSLEVIQDYGVNLICTDEGIDSSQASGRLLISVLSAVAQIERENILEQTMNGRREKARQGLWNGGQAPFGYKLVDGKLEINEEEAKIVKKIYERYVTSSISMRSLAIELNRLGATRKERGNILGDFWGESSVRRILNNPIYIGKIEWGHRQNQKVKGSKEMKRVYTNDNVIISKGAQKPIIDEETFNKALAKREAVAMSFRGVKKNKLIHPLSGILFCPICGEHMIVNASVSNFADGRRIVRYRYQCNSSKQKDLTRREPCDYKITYPEDVLETLIKRAINTTLANPNFIDQLKKDFSQGKSDLMYREQLEQYNKNLRNLNAIKTNIENRIDTLNIDDPLYETKYEDLNKRLDKSYEDIYEVELAIDDVKKKLESFDSEIISADLIVDMLSNFSKFYDCMEPDEKRQMFKLLIKKVIPAKISNEDKYYQLDRIEFNFPIFKNINVINTIKENSDEKLDYGSIPTEMILSKFDKVIEFGNGEDKVELEPINRFTDVIKPIKPVKEKLPKELIIKRNLKVGSNYEIIKFVKEKYNLTVYGQLIRTVKKILGIEVKVINEYSVSDSKYKLPLERFDAIVEALKALNLVPDELKDSYDSKVIEARNKLLVNSLNKTSKKEKIKEYSDIIKDVKNKYNIIITPDNINSVLHIIGLNEEFIIPFIPSVDKSKLILQSLLDNKWIEENDSYVSKLEEFYIKIKENTQRKNKLTNNQIIEEVKTKYSLTVNSSMISYVRDKLGICVKAKDNRYDPTQKNKRIPNAEQYNAIVNVLHTYQLA